MDNKHQSPVNKVLGISNSLGNFAWFWMLSIEIISLYHFNKISKTNNVKGIELGNIIILIYCLGYFGFYRDNSDP